MLAGTAAIGSEDAMVGGRRAWFVSSREWAAKASGGRGDTAGRGGLGGICTVQRRTSKFSLNIGAMEGDIFLFRYSTVHINLFGTRLARRSGFRMSARGADVTRKA